MSLRLHPVYVSSDYMRLDYMLFYYWQITHSVVYYGCLSQGLMVL